MQVLSDLPDGTAQLLGSCSWQRFAECDCCTPATRQLKAPTSALLLLTPAAAVVGQVEVNESTGWVTVTDDGRGIPTDVHPSTGRRAPACELLHLLSRSLHSKGVYPGESSAVVAHCNAFMMMTGQQ